MTWSTPKSLSFAASGDNVAIAGVAGKRIRVHGIDLALASVTTVTVKNGATGFTGAMTLNGLSKPLQEAPHYVCDIGADFIVALGGTVQCSGAVWYRQD